MKRYKAEKALHDLLERVEIHDDVWGEIETLVVRKGITKRFIKIFAKNIELIETLGMDVIQTNNFEKLKNANGLYSMKFKGKDMNLRMLYSYDENTETIMLHLFYERDDASKDSYEEHIPIALRRMHDWREV